LRFRAIGRIERSTLLESISMRRKRCSDPTCRRWG
jgi:hypothetical protein